MAAWVGGEEDALRHQLFPGDPLAGEKEATQEHSCGQPGSSAADGGTAQTQPLLHDVDLPEKVSAADFHGQAAEQDEGSVDPQNRRDRDRVPVDDPGVVGGEMAAALAGEKGTDQGDEEHEVAGQGEKQHHAVAAEEVSGTTTSGRPVVPVFAVAATTSRPAGYRRLAAKSRV